MRCNGKCQMMKKLQQEEKKDQQEPTRKSANKCDELSSKSFFASILWSFTQLAKDKYPILPSLKTTKRCFEVFHPPCACV